jgi:GLPGLI family protein
MRDLKKYLLICFVFTLGIANAQVKIIGDCTIDFGIKVMDANGNVDETAPLAKSKKTVFIKGKQVRADIQSENFQQTTIINSATNSAVILRAVGTNKYMTDYNEQKWAAHNNRYDGMTFSFSPETKNILGYTCKRAEAKLKDGSVFVLFYTEAIKPSADENPEVLKNIPGFVLEYESQLENGAKRIRFTAEKISFDPVPALKFEVPSSGYRLLDGNRN